MPDICPVDVENTNPPKLLSFNSYDRYGWAPPDALTGWKIDTAIPLVNRCETNAGLVTTFNAGGVITRLNELVLTWLA